jgi:hypothetical protein
MALKEIAVDGLTLVDDNATNTVPFDYEITSVPSQKVKAEGGGVYKQSLNFTIPTGQGISGMCVLAAPLIGSISPTATKTKAEGGLVLRKGDSVTVVGSGQSPSGTSCPLTFNVRISDAGQSKVKAQ